MYPLRRGAVKLVKGLTEKIRKLNLVPRNRKKPGKARDGSVYVYASPSS